MARHLDLEGSFNARDLGGYPTRDGRVTEHGAFIRTGNLDKLAPAATQQLTDYGVKTVIDLRDEAEAMAYPDAFARSTTVRYLNLPMFGDTLSRDAQWRLETDEFATMHQLYSHYLERCQPQIKTIMAAMADNAPATVFHCYAGKDRTGVIAGLLLNLAGVPDEVIAEDYAHTTPRIRNLVEDWRADAIANQRELWKFERDSSSQADTMVNLLRYLTAHYGDASQYLLHVGLVQAQVDTLRSRLIR